MAFYTRMGLAPARELTADDYKPTFGEYLKAVWDDTDADDPGSQIAGMDEMNQLRYGQGVREIAEEGGLTGGLETLRSVEPLPALSLDEQKAYIKAEGLEGVLTPDQYYTKDELHYLARLTHEARERQLVREQAPAWMAPFGFAAGLTESLTDPINLATSFVPVVGEARVMSLLGKAGSAWGRAGVRAGVGAVEGAAGAALVEPMIIAGKDNLQQEYSFAGSLMNVVFGAGMGAALHPLSGFVGDWKRARRGQRQPWEYVPASDTTEGLRAENAQVIWRGMRESGSEQLAPEHAEAAAALWDATLRGYAYDTGELVEDLYRQYRVEYRGGKLEVLPAVAEADGREHVSILDGEGRDERQSGGVPQMEQATYRSKAASIRDFLAEVGSVGNQGTYVFGSIKRSDVGMENIAIELRGDTVRHIRKNHPDFDDWERIEDTIQNGKVYELQPDRTMKLPGRAFVVEEGKKFHVVVGTLQHTKHGPRFVMGTSFVDSAKRARKWLKQKQAIPFYQSVGTFPTWPSPRDAGRISELEQNSLSSGRLSQQGKEGKPVFQTSGEGERSGAVITVRGDELGVPEGADIREYRKAAREVYRELQKTPAHREDLGEIRFSGDGFREMKQAGADKRKWQLVPKLKELVETAEYIGSVSLNKVRNDRITAFHWLEIDVELHGERLRVGLNIAEDFNGNKFYNLLQDVEEFKAQKEALGSSQKNKSGGQGLSEPFGAEPAESSAGPQRFHQDASASIEKTITTSTDGVNLYILSEGAQGEAPRARVSFGEKDAYAVVEFFKAADPSSAPHEMYHIFRRIMSELYDDPRASEAFKERYRKACEFVGTEPGKVWTPEQEEKFARAGERFLLEGVAPNARMHDVMESFRQWMGEIYGNAERSGLEISDGMRKVFGDMLGTAEDGDLNFRCALGKLLDYAPERDIDTSFELPDRTPEQALEAYMADAAARMDEAFNALADKPEVQEYISAIYEAELAAADEAITKAQTRVALRQEAAASLMRGQHEQR